MQKITESKITLRFSIFAHLFPGEQLFVAGSCPELGKWDLSKGIQLFSNNLEQSEPKMYASDFVSFEIPNKIRGVSYKYAIKSNTNYIWEAEENRYLELETNDFVISLLMFDNEIFLTPRNYEERYGHKQERKLREKTLYKYAYKIPKKPTRICPYHHEHSEIIYFKNYSEIYAVFPQKYKLLKMDARSILGMEDNEFYYHKNQTLYKCHIDSNTYEIIQKWLFKNASFNYDYSMFCSALSKNYGYLVSNKHAIKLRIDSSNKCYKLPDRKKFESHSEIFTKGIACKVVSGRYLYYFTSFEITRLDILDEEAGWLLIFKFPKKGMHKCIYNVLEFASDYEILIYYENKPFKIRFILADLFDFLQTNTIHFKNGYKGVQVNSENEYFSPFICSKHNNVILCVKKENCKSYTVKGFDFVNGKKLGPCWLSDWDKEFNFDK